MQAGSPAIDKGQTLADVTNDYAGGARPFGAAYDIGAYESGSPPGSGGPPTDIIPGVGPISGGGSGGTGNGGGGGLSNCAR